MRCVQLSLFGEDQEPEDMRTPEILFGSEQLERIVGAEVVDRALVLWRRTLTGEIERQELSFRPWLLVSAPSTDLGGSVSELPGEGFRYLHEFESISAWYDARRIVMDGRIGNVAPGDPVRMALVRTGHTLFKGMSLTDVVRMQIDIETAGLTAEAPDCKVLMVAVGDNRGLLDTIVGTEREILSRLSELVRLRDPDVIEGHNILGFDLPFLLERARQAGVRLALGRDGSEPRLLREQNLAIAGNSRPFRPCQIHGRSVIDTYLTLRRYDAARRELESYGLKDAARALGIASESRVILPRDEMLALFTRSPELVTTYARQDIEETARLAEIVTPTEFYQTQMVPDSYSSVAVMGSGQKINLILMRAYLAAGSAIPVPKPTAAYAGGYTDLRATGRIAPIVKADVESLYPSIMLTQGIRPATDSLGVFLPALRELTHRRLEAKERARVADGALREYWSGLQSSFKILINSFYGYLGAASFNFNDPAAAGSVTSVGRDIVRQIARAIDETGGRIVEIDTDGVYFVPPPAVSGEEQERAYVTTLGNGLPEGIRLAFDGRYRAMLSLKTKNYVLEDYSGKLTLRGASLRSKADEPFGREFLAEAVRLLLSGDEQAVGRLYVATLYAIMRSEIPIEKLARTERVTEKTFTSAAKQRSAAVARTTAVGDWVVVYERRNGGLALLDEYTPGDENVTYYMEKLHKFACRLTDAFTGPFGQIVPRPTAAGLAQAAQLDLFS